jgi:hypothetical protein
METLTGIEKRKGFVKKEDLSYYTEFNSSPDMPLPADLLNVTAINIRRKYVNQYLNYPINVRHDNTFHELGENLPDYRP